MITDGNHDTLRSGRRAHLTAVHPGVDPAEAVRRTGWDLQVSSDLETTQSPTQSELTLLRESLDPTASLALNRCSHTSTKSVDSGEAPADG